MTVHKLSAGDGYTYLTRQVASADELRVVGQDLAGYYTASGNPPGRWLGAGAADLGMSGVVSEPQMVALFGQGRHPDADAILAAERVLGTDPAEAERLTRLGKPFGVYADRKAVAGYDLVFSPVKSVSVLWALGDARVREQVEAAHREALEDVIGWLEREAAFTRLGNGGPAQVETHGLICAVFDHRDSRLGDPDLHTHVAISNKVRARVAGSGGPRWLALDARVLYQAGVAASERYNTRLEDAMSRRLGVVFVERADSVRRDKRVIREVAGIPVELVKHFSQRRAVIEDRLADLSSRYRRHHGRDPSPSTRVALAQQATLDTREGKRPPRGFGDQLQQWRTRAVGVLGRQRTRRLVHDVTGQPVPTLTPERVDVDALAAQVIQTLEGSRSTWTRWHVIAETERVTRPLRLATAEERDRLVDSVRHRVCRPGMSIRIEAPELVDDPAALRRSDGVSVYRMHGSQRYTTVAVLTAERDLLAAAAEHTGQSVDTQVAAAAVGIVERHHHPLDPGQRALVDVFVCDDRRLVVAVGPAGSGKTTAMRAAAAAWDAAGRRLIPLAASAKSADVLAADLGRRAENLHKYLHELDHIHPPSAATAESDAFFTLRRGDVVLVDEAGLAGTGRLHRLVTHARAAGAQVRLLGDPAQLAAVESGGALSLLADDTGAVELRALHRFADPAEAAATLLLRRGDPAAVDFYQTRGRVRSGTADAMVDAAFDGWRSDVLAGRVAIMGAADNDTVRQLSARARADRVARGAVTANGVDLADGNRAGSGDWVTTRTNDRTLATTGGGFVKNGDLWQVTTQHRDGSLTVERLGARTGRVRLPAAYVTADVELAYATTAHRSQGGTVETAHPVITEAMSREALYVLASRARHFTTLYVATDGQPDIALDHPPAGPRTARDVLEQVLRQQTAELSATETIRRTQDEPHRLPGLIAAYEHALNTAPAAVVARHRTQNRNGSCGPVLPWVSRGLGDEKATGEEQQWATSLRERADQIAARVGALVDSVESRPPGWALHLLPPPPDLARRKQWRHNVGLVAGYREQFRVATGSADLLGSRPPEPGADARAHDLATAALRELSDVHTSGSEPGLLPRAGQSEYLSHRRPPPPSVGIGAPSHVRS